MATRAQAQSAATTKAAAAIYHRVSTLDQNAGAAGRELGDLAKRLGLRVTMDVRETASGMTHNRPGLARVMDAARAGKISAVLVWKLDRFGRSALDLLGRLRELDSAGVRFIVATQGIDLRPGGDAMSRLLLTMLAAIAEFERDLISDRTRLGLARARRAGKQLGRPAAKRPAAAKVRALRAQQLSWSQVAAKLGCSEWTARAAERESGTKGQRYSPRLKKYPVRKGG